MSGLGSQSNPLMHVRGGALLQHTDGEATRGNNGGNNGAVAGWRWPTRDSSKCLKQQRPAWVVAGRRRLRSRRSRVRIAAGALDSVWVQRPPRGRRPQARASTLLGGYLLPAFLLDALKSWF